MPRSPGTEPTLRQRALAALTRREYSRVELARKIGAHAESREQLDALLDALEGEKLLSNARFAESLTHRREQRYGSLRIGRELEQHGLTPELVRERMSDLAATETARCRAVWEKKFNQLPQSLEERARQTRFLAARGFEPDVIRRVLNAKED